MKPWTLILIFAWLAITGHTDVRSLRGLPMGQEGKVAVLWVMAALSAGFPVMALLKVKAMVSGVALEVGEDHALVPYGLGLRKRKRLGKGEVLEVGRQDFGAGFVMAVRWADGQAYLPEGWFLDVADIPKAAKALSALRAPG